MINKVVLVLIINIILSVIIGCIVIPIFKKNIYQRLNRYVSEHKSKAGTPTMGGLIFIIPVLLTNLFIIKSNTLLIILITFVLYGLIGFISSEILLSV